MIVPLKSDHKRVNFQHVQPQVKPDMNPQGAPRLVGNHNEPNDLGQQNDAPNGHLRLPIHTENRAGNDVQQAINNEALIIHPGVDPF